MNPTLLTILTNPIRPIPGDHPRPVRPPLRPSVPPVGGTFNSEETVMNPTLLIVAGIAIAVFVIIVTAKLTGAG
jgi:hypothetical protein